MLEGEIGMELGFPLFYSTLKMRLAFKERPAFALQEARRTTLIAGCEKICQHETWISFLHAAFGGLEINQAD